MEGRWSDAERGRGMPNVQQLTIGGISLWLEAGDLPVLPQALDTVGLEAVAMCRCAPLAIKDTGDNGIGVVHRQPANECDGVFTGADGGLALGQRQVEFAQCIAFPPQCHVRRRLFALDPDDNLIDQSPQQLFPVARRRRGRSPDRSEVGAEGGEVVAFSLREHSRELLLATRQLGLGSFERSQALLPRSLEPARHQPIVRVDGMITPLREARRVARPLDAEPPLLERALAIPLEPFGGGKRSCKPCRLERGDERCSHRLVDLYTADGKAIATASLDEELASAMVAGR